MEGQTSIYDFLEDAKPQIGSRIFFRTGTDVVRAEVISLSAEGLSEKYFTVKTRKEKIHYIVNWFQTREAAEADVRSFWRGKIGYR